MRRENQETPLHLVASYKPSQVNSGCGFMDTYMYIFMYVYRHVWMLILSHAHTPLSPPSSHITQALTTVSMAAVKEAPWPSESMAQIASLLLQYHANPDSQDSNGYTPLQKSIECNNDDVFTILLINPV